jgi:hypothetical protein
MEKKIDLFIIGDPIIKDLKFCASPYCGKLLERKEGENLTNWKKRKTCGQKCRNEIPKRKVPLNRSFNPSVKKRKEE